MAIYHYSIMILEDSPEDSVLYCSYLNQEQCATYNLIQLDTGQAALKTLDEIIPDLILIKSQLPDMGGLEFVQKLKEQRGDREIPLIMLAEHESAKVAVEAMKNGFQDYIVKSQITSNILCCAVKNVLDKQRSLKQIRIQQQQQQLLARIFLRIRQFLGLQEILQTAVAEVQKLLTTDRVIVYQFDQEMNGQIVAESVLPKYANLLNQKIENNCFKNMGKLKYQQGRIRAITDIYDSGLGDYYINLLERFQVKAILVLPILVTHKLIECHQQDDDLWGLLIVNQCDSARQWQQQEIEILEQLCVQLGLAIQQAELYENLRNTNIYLEEKIQERTQQLQASEARFRAIFNNKFQFSELLTTTGILLEANETALNFGGLKLEDVINKPFWEVLWWQTSTANQERLKQAIARVAKGEFSSYEVDILGVRNQIATIEESFTKIGNTRRCLRTNKTPLYNPEGEIISVLGSYEDITERKEIKQALQESERRYATLTTSAPVGIYHADAEGNYLYVNPQWIKITQLAPQQAAGNGWKKVLHPEDRENVETEWNLLVTTGKTFCLEYRFVSADGLETWVFGQAVPEKDQQGKVIGYVGTITDITTRKKTEQALRHSEQLYRTLVDNFPNGAVILFDHDLRYLLAGGMGLEEVGLSKAEMEGKTLWEIFPPEICEVSAPLFQQALAGKAVVCEVSFKNFLYLCHHIPVQDEQGNVIAGIMMSQNITERKKAEQERDRLLQILEQQNQTLEAEINQRTAELQNSKERFRNLVETSSDWVWEVNEFAVYTYCSPQIIHVLGYSPAEILGKTPFDFMPPEEAERVLKEFTKFASVHAPFQCLENINYHKDGRLIILETSAVPIFDADKQFRGYRGMDRDITLRKQTENTLRQNEARFQRIASNAPGVMYQYVLHPDGSHEFVYISDRCREIYELEPETAKENADSLLNLGHPEDIPELRQSIINSAHFLQQWSWEGRIITPSNRLKWIQGISEPEKQANGDILWDGLIIDITERKQTEIALRNLSDRLNLAIKSAQIGIWDWDIINDRLFWDDRMYELYGVKASDFSGAYQAWETALHPDDLPYCRTVVQQAIAGEKDYESEFRIIWPDGTIRFIKAYALVQRDEQGKAQRMIGINFDITERKLSEVKIQEAEQQLRNLSTRLKLAVTSAKIGIWDWDLINDSLLWDEQMYKLFGVASNNLPINQTAWLQFLQLIHPEDRDTLNTIIQQVITEDKELDTEFRVILPDGKIRILKGYGLVHYNSQGQPQRMIGINYDITQRKQEELENKRLKERLQFVLSASPAVIYTCKAGANYQATFISDNVQNILGYTAKQWLQEPNIWLDNIHPEDLSVVLTELSHLEEKEYNCYQYRFRHKNGHYLWIEDEYRLVFDQTGNPREIIGYVVDISEQQAALHERELAEAEIIRSRDLREAIFNESTDAIFLVDAQTVKTIDCNQKAVEMFAAKSKNDLIGIEGHQLQKQQFSPEEIQVIMDEMKIHGVWSREVEYKTFTGNLFWGNLAAKEITVGNQKMNLVRVSDISQRKQVETQLQETNQQLAASNAELARATRLKDEFLANMSHELRTPLNAILGISEGLQDSAFGTINEKQRQALHTIERSGKHLLELINDILDLSKIEAGQIQLHYTPIAISQICQSSLAFIKQQAFQKSLQLEVKIQPHLPEILVDERRIRQVLINLLNNAVKFTPEGGKITLEANHQLLSSDTQPLSSKNYICINIIDTGIGIASENIHKLFQPFVQIDSALNRQYSGTGLGLALVKRLVEIHGGQVSVSSKIGTGSCFTVALPCGNLCHVNHESTNPVSSDLDLMTYQATPQSPLILLAEDNEANIFTISNYLEVTGYRVIVAKNGREAIAFTKTHLPDLILMDIQMPEVDGLEAIKTIRQAANLVNIPIIALTALAMPGDKEKCLLAGATYYLTKPVRLKELTTIIKQFLTIKAQVRNEY